MSNELDTPGAMRARMLGLGLVIAAALALSSWDGQPAPPGANPVRAEAAALFEKVYAASESTVRVPVEWAAPRLGRLGLAAWLTTLPLPDDVAARVQGRLAAEGFVDELVPFALFVKDTYAAPDEPDFATWARAELRPVAGQAGWEHSLFSFAPPAADDSSATGVDAVAAARLVRLYDAVYLQDAPLTAPVADRLVCDGDDAVLAARTERALPIVRELLTDVERGLEPGDLRDGLRHALADATTLEAMTLSLVEFVDGEVCKHYRIFAEQVQTERLWRAWLTDALLTPGNPDGWAFLRWHAARPHSVQFVVDGLQGHLVDALARGQSQHPFFVQVAAELERDRLQKPTLASTRAAPPSSTGALAQAAQGVPAARLPTLARIVNSPGFVRHGLSTTPTISVRNLPIAMTGAPVAGPQSTGIPNFHFVDRTYVQDGVQQGRPWYFYGNDALRLTALTRETGMRTIFERLSRQLTMSCGGQYDEAADASFDGFLALALGEHSRDFGEVRCVASLAARGKNERRIAELGARLAEREARLSEAHLPWELYDRWGQAREADAVRAEVAELAALLPEAMPDHLLVYNPWPDHFAHGKGPFSDEIIGPTGELVRLDHWIGRVEATYADAGRAERTLYGMAGDHGLTPVSWLVSPEAEFVDGLAATGVKLEVRKISSDEGEGPKLTHRLRPPSMRGLDLVVASTAGGNYMMDFFVDQGAAWARQPVLAELRALRTLDGHTLDVPAELLTRLGDTLDYLVVRGEPCAPEGGTTVVMGTRAGRVGTTTLRRQGARIHVGLDGPDLLDLAVAAPYERYDEPALREAADLRKRCLSAPPQRPDEWCTEAEWRTATRHSVRPDSVVQLAHLYDTDRAGTVNLFPRDGVGYNSRVPGRHAGESFHEKDAFVGVWGAPVARAAPDVAVNGSVPMVLYGWLTGTEPQEGQDGWGWPGWSVTAAEAPRRAADPAPPGTGPGAPPGSG